MPPFNHGRGDQYSVGMLVNKAREHGVSAYISDRDNRWPAMHLLDIAAVFRLALEKGQAGSVYHAVAGEGVRLKDAAAAIGKKLGVPVASKSLAEAQRYFWVHGVCPSRRQSDVK